MDKLADMQLINDRHLLAMHEQDALMKDLPQWHIGKTDTVLRLVRSFDFGNFLEALAFANMVGALAEEYNHHPALLVEWGKTTVSWWTHSLGGLHKNDFIMASKTDRCYRAG